MEICKSVKGVQIFFKIIVKSIISPNMLMKMKTMELKKLGYQDFLNYQL